MRTIPSITVAMLLSVGSIAAFAQGGPSAEIIKADHAVTIPVREMISVPPKGGLHEHPVHPLPGPVSNSPTTGIQTLATTAPSFVSALSFAGVGNGDYGFAPNAAPPDTNGSVGADFGGLTTNGQYVQWVNESFAVFNKHTGALLAGPTTGNTLFQALGSTHPCAQNNDGDPIAQYDKLANRWVLTQFSVTNGGSVGYWQCVAVSSSADATGTFHVYAFNYGTVQFVDYPKLGVWPDAYYVTYNIFNNGSTFAGAKLCAMDRNSMIAGAAATQQCFQLSSSFGGVLPADLDGTNPPPSGAAEYFTNFGSNSLNVWRFHVDWTTPANTTLTSPANIPVNSFATACGGRACVPQSGTSQKLDSLGDRLMYRLSYRNFATPVGTYGGGPTISQALLVNHSVQIGGKRGNTGVRWYQLDAGTTTPTLVQQNTYSPDSNFRWMGSAAMDKAGNIAVGYSISSKSLFPSINFAGRVPTDSQNLLSAETSLKNGTGSQLSNLNRWGDYSNLSVDPQDDCTMYYTTEYLKANGTFNWSTWISSFKFSNCQ